MRSLCLIAAALPPKLDGIGDYSASLAAELAHTHRVSILTGQYKAVAIPDVEIEPAFTVREPGSVRRIPAILQARRPDWVLLQYNPFSFGRWGLNLYLPRVMHLIRRVSPTTRFALMVHEPFVPRIHWKFAVMSIWQRYQLRRLGQAADIIFFSIDRWVQEFSPWFPTKTVVHLPVGSSMPCVPIGRAEARCRLGIDDDTIVLGLFGTLHAARLEYMIRDAADAVRDSGKSPLILYMGPHGDVMREMMAGHALIADGPLPPDEISRRFAAIDCYLAPFIDGVSTRRTSMMTALQHSVPVAGTSGHLTDALLQTHNGTALLLTDKSDREGFARQVVRLAEDAQLRSSLGSRGHILFQEQFSWERIAGRLLEHLESVEQASSTGGVRR